MFGIGMTEMIVIAVIALIFIGPDQIPEVARTVGRFLNDLRRSTDDIKRQFSDHAGIPRDLSALEQWQKNRHQYPNQEVDIHEGMNPESIGHAPAPETPQIETKQTEIPAHPKKTDNSENS